MSIMHTEQFLSLCLFPDSLLLMRNILHVLPHSVCVLLLVYVASIRKMFDMYVPTH